MIPRPPSLDAVLTTLADEGLTAPVDPAAARQALLDDDERTGADTPMYIRTLVTSGAWLAGGMLIGLCAMLLDLDSGADCVIAGALLGTAGVAISRHERATYNEFLVQAGLVFIVAGNALLVFGVTDTANLEDTGFGFLLMAAGAVLFAVYPLVQGRTGAALEFLAGAAGLVYSTQNHYALDVLETAIGGAMVATWLGQAQWQSGRWAKLYEPVSRALVIAFFLGLFTTLMSADGYPNEAQPVGIPTTVTSALLLLWVAADALKETVGHVRRRDGMVAVVCIGGLALLTYSAPGIIGTALCLVLGLHRRSRWLVASATLFMCIFGVGFYYQLNIDLLTKSGMLAGSGLLLLGARLALRAGYAAPREVT